MALNLGALALQITANPAPVNRVLRQVEASAVASGKRSGGGFARGLTSAIGLVAKIGTGAAVAFGAAAAAAAGYGIKVASGNEQARISFTTMLGSARKANVFLAQLQQFAAKTPFEFPELQTAASSLISVGIKAKDIIPIMTSLGNATSGMGTGAEGVKRATVALQQMTAAGRITAEDLNQLRDAGVPVFELLTKATGKSTAEIAKMAANGKLGRKELEQLMAALRSGKGLERFAGLMDQQSRSLAGLWSTFKDTAGQALAGVATTAFPLMKSGLAAISTGLGHVSAWVSDNKDSLGAVFRVASSTLGTYGRMVITVWKSIIAGFGLGKDSFKNFADFLTTHQEDITAGIIAGGKAAVQFGVGLSTLASVGLRAFAFLMDGQATLVQLGVSGFGLLLKAEVAAFGWIPGIGPKIKAAEATFRGFTTGMVSGMHGAAAAARATADGIDKKLIPGLHLAGRGLDDLGRKAISSAHARDVVAKAEINHRKTLDAATTAAKANGRTMDANTQAGRSNRTALINLASSSQNYIQKLIDTNANSKRVSAASRTARAEFIRVATSMGVSRDRAKELATAYFKIPTKRSTNVAVKFSSSGKVQLNVGSAHYIANATGGVLPGFTPGRDVHTFVSASPGVPNLKLSGGEAIMRPEWTRAVGGPRRVAQMNEDAKRGKVTALAGGGTLSFAGAGTIPSMSRATTGAQRVSVDAGSAVVRQAAAAVVKAAMAALRKQAAAAAAKAASSAAGYSGPLPGGRGAAGIRAIARALGASYIAHHIDPQGGNAYDLGSSGARNRRIGNALVSAHGRLGLRYVIRQMQIASARSGWNWRGYHPITGSGDFRHVNHVHVSYANGTLGARRGIAGVAENGMELVVNPQLRRFKGGERVYDHKDTKRMLGGDWSGSPLIGQFTQNFPQSLDPIVAANIAGADTVARLSAVGIG